MNARHFAPLLLALSAPALLACGGPAETESDKSGWAGIAETARAEIREEMATQTLDIGEGVKGLPRAGLTPQGDLVIDGKTITLSAEQRTKLLDFRTQLAGVAEAGAEVGLQGAAIATTAMKEAAKAALTGDKASIEERMKGSTDAIQASAKALCARLPALLASQRAAAEAVPEFRPYATMDEQDINECSAEIDGATP